MRIAEDLSCAELVEFVNDYIEDALPPDERAQFDEHLRTCGGCTAYLDQMRTTIELTGRLRLDDLTLAAKAELLDAFSDWRTSPTRGDRR
jgi:anti-sigma factor RsiW